MEDGIINVSELKAGQQFTLDIASHEVVLTKLEEPNKFTMGDWFTDEVEIYIIESQIEEDKPLHYALKPMSLEEGLRLNKGKFGKDIVMHDFLGREVEGIEMEEAEETED
ncbi:MAG: hypothetical protein GY814_08410 [Gammaproteobacteria bacterium]|nr:hypothetical protein [Gammaproteobacteria bacterium]